MQTKTHNNHYRIYIRILLCLALVFLFLIAMTGFAAAETKTGTVATTALNLRSGPGSNYTSLGLLSINKVVIILDETYDTRGDKWYHVISPAGTEGFVSAKYIEVNNNAEYQHDGDFEAYLTSQGFPESYKPYLRQLHAQYPQWIFKAADTGLDWESVLAAESKTGTSLVASSSPASWKSMAEGAYDFTTGKYIQYDSGGWVCASKEIVAYYLDPRNFINPIGAFQFLTHSYDETTQTKEGLQKVISFLPGTYGTSLLRNHALRGVFEEMSAQGFPREVVEAVKDSVDCNLYFFGDKVDLSTMYLVLILGIVIAVGLYVGMNLLSGRKRH